MTVEFFGVDLDVTLEVEPGYDHEEVRASAAAVIAECLHFDGWEHDLTVALGRIQGVASATWQVKTAHDTAHRGSDA